MKKINKKKVFIILSIIMISYVALNFFYTDVRAELNPTTNKFAEGMAGAFNGLVGALSNTAMNSVFAGFSMLLTTIAGVLFLLIGLIFSGSTGSIFPTPETIIFNRIAILDVNFFNPNKYSLLADIDVIKQIYNSFHTIAVSVFVIAAMIVGIKMAISAVASEKAQAKKALVSWLTGVLLLFLMRLIIAGIFELNEYLVWKISEATGDVVITIDTGIKIDDVASAFLGNPIPLLLTAGTTIFNGGDLVVHGYFGFMIMAVFNAFSGDIISAILLFIILGQTITLFVTYAKRLIYIIILGVCAPLVVAVDTINKATKGSSTVLSNWFKEFVGTVFLQTFHAILMLVILSIIGAITGAKAEESGVIQGSNTALYNVVIAILTAGLLKFEKLYKKLFGLSETGMNDFNAGKALIGLQAAKAGIKAISDNRGKVKQAGNNLNNLKRQRGSLARRNAIQAIEDASKATSSTEKEKMLTFAKESHEIAKRDGAYNAKFDNNGANVERAISLLEANACVGGNNTAQQIINNNQGPTYVEGGNGPTYTQGGGFSNNPTVASAKARFDEVVSRGFSAGDAEYDTAKTNYGNALINSGANVNTTGNAALTASKARFDEVVAEGFTKGDTEYDTARATYAKDLASHTESMLKSSGSSYRASNGGGNSFGGSVPSNRISEQSIRNGLVGGTGPDGQGMVGSRYDGGQDIVADEIKKLRNDLKASNRQNEMDKLNKDIDQATKQLGAAKLEMAMGPANTIIGMSLAAGSGREELGGFAVDKFDALSRVVGNKFGSQLESALSKSTDKVVKNAVKRLDKIAGTDDI